MADLSSIKYPLGHAQAWVFDLDNKPLLDYNGRPIARFITSFKYMIGVI